MERLNAPLMTPLTMSPKICSWRSMNYSSKESGTIFPQDTIFTMPTIIHKRNRKMKQSNSGGDVTLQRNNDLAKKIQVFKMSKGFLQLQEESLKKLALCAIPCQFKKGEIVFREGDSCDYFYIIQKGRVKCFKQSPSGKRLIILIGKEHETF